MNTRHRTVVTLALGVAAALAFLPAVPDHQAAPAAVQSDAPAVTVLNDGSTSDTGPQPAQRPVARLKAGQRPPQFVVFAFDAPTEDGRHLFSDARTAARASGAEVTFFLRGIDLLPASKSWQYQPPQRPVGTAAVPFPADAQVRATLQQVGRAWLDGDEIATGFVGQFCAPDWSGQNWQDEISQGYSMVNFWKTGTGFTDLPPLPFDYQTELVGGRAPCPEGLANLHAAEKEAGWRYDASAPGSVPNWPTQTDGIWDFPRPQAASDYRAAFERAYDGNRAPLVIDTDLRQEPALRTAEAAMKELCHRDGVRCVSFRELADWLDAQDPGFQSHR